MDLQPVIDRLKASLTGFKSIGGVVDLDAAINGVVAVPAAFVMPLSEEATANDLLGQTSQRIVSQLGVVLVCSNRRDSTGAAALNDLHSLQMQVRNLLVGWIPDAATAEPVHLAGSSLMKFDGDGRLWWVERFSIATYFWSVL
jgi:hypothetical protein